MSMADSQSPLEELENELRAISRVAPPVTLRDRVLGTVRGALWRHRVRDWVCTVATAAALAALWLNLSWSLSQPMGEVRPASVTSPSLGPTARAIQRFLPGTTRSEALGLALLLRAAGSIDPCPEVRPPPHPWHEADRF